MSRLKNKIKKFKQNPRNFFIWLSSKGLFDRVSDLNLISFLYYTRFGKKLNLTNPIDYNQKLQWLKLYDRNEKYTELADKYEVRKFVTQKIGKEYLIPNYRVWNGVEEINWGILPDQFVLKCTHDSGGLVICEDKAKLDLNKAKKKLNKTLQKNYYYSTREWPYKNIKPRIIAEKYMTTESGAPLNDYRFFCFNGDPKFVSLDIDINNKFHTKRNLYDLNWNLIDAEISYPQDKSKEIKEPPNFQLMIDIARKLSENIPHVRVDLYNIDGRIYFGEMTFFHQSGFGDIRPQEFNELMGSWINIHK